MNDPPPVDDVLAAGRAALARGAWAEARSSFEEAVLAGSRPEAFEGLGWAAWWLEDVESCLAAREAAYRLYREAGDARGAARAALWLGDDHIEFLGAEAVAEGWFGRAARILEGLEASPEHGWLAVFEANAALDRHDLTAAQRLAGEARELGRRLGEVDLEMFALATEGMALVDRGEVGEGMRRLGEATAAALAGEYHNLAPAAWTCCRLMSACEQVRDYGRGEQWCEKIDEFSRRMGTRFVTGVCRAHYAAIRAWHGSWDEAERELVDAMDHLTGQRRSWRSEALVRLGELRRRQGRLQEAEELFRRSEGHPLARRGLAEVALDRGDAVTARELLHRMLRGLPPASSTAHAGTLELLVRAEAALGEQASAAERLEELAAIVAVVPTEPLRAAVQFAEGTLAAAAGDHDRARECFEDAADLFERSRAPLELGRARLELSRSLAALGRADAARREARAAWARFREIGAGLERARTEALLDELGPPPAATVPSLEGALTARQVEVLRLVAEGLGDREIARRLVLSEHTVHRHVANIYARLGCSSRAAAVARAGRLGLL